VYKKSEFTFSPGLGYTSTESKYLGKTTDDFKYNFNFTNIGMVFAGNIGSKDTDKPEWKGIQFGIGVNRLQNFNNRTLVEGFNNLGTILDIYHASAQGTHYDQLGVFDTQLAFNTYLLDTLGSSTNYIQAYPGGATQRKMITTTGGIDEMVMTLGGNYNDKFYIGATIGIPFVSYNEISTYQEIDEDNSVADFNSLTITDEVSTTGAGVNLKVGMIYRVTDWVRVSGAFHIPTFYSLTDEWQRKMDSDLEGMGSYSDKSPIGRFDYSLMTPMRLIGGVAFVIANRGSVTAEYEHIDYSTSRLREKNISGSFFDANDNIRNNYTKAGNIRVGTEWVFSPFSIRGGYALYGNPFKSGLNDQTEQIISGGIGIRDKHYFIDFGYLYSTSKSDYFLYPQVVEAASVAPTKQMFVCTVGFKF